MARPRFGLRSLLLSVAALGIVLSLVIGVVSERRRGYYRSRVETFAWGEADLIESVAAELRSAREHDARGPEGRAEAAAARLRAERWAELAAWHVKMERRFAWAAEHPFAEPPPMPVPPSWMGQPSPRVAGPGSGGD